MKTIIIQSNIYINKFVDVINFLQSYSKEIYIILELYYFLLENIPSLYENVIKIIKEKKIEMEKDIKRNPYSSKINKVSFFYVIESLCKILKEELLNILSNKDYNNYSKRKEIFKFIQYFIQNLLKLEKRFLLFSKEIFLLDIIIKILSEILLKSDDCNFLEFSNEALKFLLNHNEKKNLVELLYGQNMMLLKIFKENLNEYAYLMSNVLLNYYKSESKSEIREKMIRDFFLENKMHSYGNLMEYSYPLMKIIFGFQNLEPPSNDAQSQKFFENFNVDDANKNIKKIIDEKMNPKLCELFLYIFEITCDNYFKRIKSNSKKNAKIYQQLCGGLSKNYLEYAINCFYQKKDKNVFLPNLYKIYCIAYIKIYLNYYIDIVYSKDIYLQFYETNVVNTILFSNKVNQKTTIVYYWLKLLLKRAGSWENFIKFYKENVISDEDGFRFKAKQIKLKLEEDESFLITPVLLLDYQKKK